MTEFSFCGELFKDTHIFEVQAILVSTTGKEITISLETHQPIVLLS